jgi:hypothetical protein
MIRILYTPIGSSVIRYNESAASITLSGTVNITNNGSHYSVPNVNIRINKKTSERNSEQIGYTELV